MCCSVLQCVAERCIESDYRERVRIEVEPNRGGAKNPFAKGAAIKAGDALQEFSMCWSVLQCVAVCCSVMLFVAVCCRVWQCVVVCCSVLQCVSECCYMLQCVVVCRGSKASLNVTRQRCPR